MRVWGGLPDWLVNHSKNRFSSRMLGKLTSAVNSFLLGKAKKLHSTANGLKNPQDNGVGGATLSIGMVLELLRGSNT